MSQCIFRVYVEHSLIILISIYLEYVSVLTKILSWETLSETANNIDVTITCIYDMVINNYKGNYYNDLDIIRK